VENYKFIEFIIDFRLKNIRADMNFIKELEKLIESHIAIGNRECGNL